MDITEHIAAKSDQLNADDLVGGDIQATITAVTEGSAEQPVNVHIEGHRPWRPSKTSRRVLALAWGVDTDQWVGRTVQLYRDPTVTWAGVEVGGIRIRALSHVDTPFSVSLAKSRGKKVKRRIERLETAQPTLVEVLSFAGVGLPELDAWLSSKGRPPFTELSDADVVKLAQFLTRNPGHLEDMTADDDAP